MLGLLFVAVLAVLALVATLLVAGLPGVLGLVLGLCGYLLVPFVFGYRRLAGPVGRRYLTTGFRYLGPALLVERAAGGWSLVRAGVNDDYGTIQATVEGETMDWEDAYGAMRFLAHTGRPFGVTRDDIGMIVDPLLLEIADAGRAVKEAGQLEQLAETRQGGYVRQMAAAFPLSRELVPLDITTIHYLNPGSADVDTAGRADTYVSYSQEMFGSSVTLGQVGVWIMGFLLGLGGTWVTTFIAGGGGEGGGGTDIVPLEVVMGVFV